MDGLQLSVFTRNEHKRRPGSCRISVTACGFGVRPLVRPSSCSRPEPRGTPTSQAPTFPEPFLGSSSLPLLFTPFLSTPLPPSPLPPLARSPAPGLLSLRCALSPGAPPRLRPAAAARPPPAATVTLRRSPYVAGLRTGAGVGPLPRRRRVRPPGRGGRARPLGSPDAHASPARAPRARRPRPVPVSSQSPSSVES